ASRLLALSAIDGRRGRVQVIREAEERDDVAIGELLVRAFVEQYAVKMPEVVVNDARKATLRDVANKRAVAKVWVAEAGGHVIGTIALWPPGALDSDAWAPLQWDLRHLAVDSSRRGEGVSSALLDVAETYARAHGAKEIILHVRRGAVGVAGLY